MTSLYSSLEYVLYIITLQHSAPCLHDTAFSLA